MGKSEIDFERVITDPLYRRKVIEDLKSETFEEAKNEAANNVELIQNRTTGSAA